MTMRAINIKNGKGTADDLFFDNIPKPTLKDGDVLVKVKAFGLNRMDLMQRQGHYPLPPQAPSTLGVEFSGTIAEGDVEGFHKNDEVFGLAYGGAYAEYIAVSSKMCIHKPKGISWEKAAGIPETWITATQALFLVGCFKKGETVLFHAGASSVSIAGIQLAKHAGASAVYVTAGSKGKIDFCVDKMGATKGFNYHEQDFAEEILKVTDGKGVDVIVDYVVGGGYFEKDIKCAARDGRIVFLAMMGGKETQGKLDVSQVLFKRLRIEGSTLRSRLPGYQEKLRDRLVEEALDKLEDGSFEVPIEKVFSWKDVTDAHKLMESNKTQGKIICLVD